MISDVLLIDDDPDDYEIFRDIIREISADITVAYLQDSSNLNDVLSNPPPGIIFLDYNMPKINGIFCLRMIRANKSFSRTPVILYSVYYDQVNTAYKEGANYFIVKQGSTQLTKEILKDMLEKNWETEPSGSSFDIFVGDRYEASTAFLREEPH
jgi:DNA-binding NtrC family response regulator